MFAFLLHFLKVFFFWKERMWWRKSENQHVATSFVPSNERSQLQTMKLDMHSIVLKHLCIHEILHFDNFHSRLVPWLLFFLDERQFLVRTRPISCWFFTVSRQHFAMPSECGCTVNRSIIICIYVKMRERVSTINGILNSLFIKLSVNILCIWK